MYMDDAIHATLQLMEAPKESIKIRTSYNLAGMSFSPAEIHQSLQAHYPDFEIEYQPDFRQQIADSWPNSIDDSVAKEDWKWQPQFDLKAMTATIVKHLPAFFNYNQDK
jgi:nucleoside-diphosphate-sugar epimerase